MKICGGQSVCGYFKPQNLVDQKLDGAMDFSKLASLLGSQIKLFSPLLVFYVLKFWCSQIFSESF